MGLTDTVTLIAGGQYARATRDVTAVLNAVTGRGEYDQFNPRVGLLVDAAEDIQFFGNISRSFEAPSLADLTSGGAFPFAPLNPQRATVFELGTRGQAGIVSWDIALYRAELENEFLDLAVPGARGLVTVTSNADTTVHQGLEFGLDLRPFKSALEAKGQALRLSAAYTFNDFSFDDDAVYGDNQLAGVPRHVLIAEARFDKVDRFYLSTTLRWIPDGPWADFANTERAPGYETVQITAGVTLTDGIELFGSVENLFDTLYFPNAHSADELGAAVEKFGDQALAMKVVSKTSIDARLCCHLPLLKTRLPLSDISVISGSAALLPNERRAMTVVEQPSLAARITAVRVDLPRPLRA